MTLLPILLALIALVVAYAMIYGSTVVRNDNSADRAHNPPAEASDEELTAQREKILHMVEQRIITADEGVQLLSALPQIEQLASVQGSRPASRITPTRKMVHTALP